MQTFFLLSSTFEESGLNTVKQIKSLNFLRLYYSIWISTSLKVIFPWDIYFFSRMFWEISILCKNLWNNLQWATSSSSSTEWGAVSLNPENKLKWNTFLIHFFLFQNPHSIIHLMLQECGAPLPFSPKQESIHYRYVQETSQ